MDTHECRSIGRNCSRRLVEIATWLIVLLGNLSWCTSTRQLFPCRWSWTTQDPGVRSTSAPARLKSKGARNRAKRSSMWSTMQCDELRPPVVRLRANLKHKSDGCTARRTPDQESLYYALRMTVKQCFLWQLHSENIFAKSIIMIMVSLITQSLKFCFFSF